MTQGKIISLNRHIISPNDNLGLVYEGLDRQETRSSRLALIINLDWSTSNLNSRLSLLSLCREGEVPKTASPAPVTSDSFPSTASPTLYTASATSTNYWGQGSSAMPRRKRSPTTEDFNSMHQSTQKRFRTGSSRKKNESDVAFNAKRCNLWFTEYCCADSDNETLGPEGMEKFCEDIGVEPENIVMLCLAWKLGAKQMGFFTKAEWNKGMTLLQCDSVQKVRGRLTYLRSLLNDPTTFKAIYRYAFDFAREKDQRSMDIETAKSMLTLVLGKHWSLFPSFHQFLEQSKYRVINKDQWCNVLEFSRLIKNDLTNYDEDGAWPVMLDEFVEWYREQLPSKMAPSPGVATP